MIALLLGVCAVSADESAAKLESPLVLAHYMPWLEAKSESRTWGWHWTMHHFDPENQTDGKREIASHFHPLIGPYDSSDVDVIEYHLVLMKLAGIDGVIVDWYGHTPSLQERSRHPLSFRSPRDGSVKRLLMNQSTRRSATANAWRL